MRTGVWIVLAMCVCWASGLQAVQEQPPSRELLARDLARAMLIHDQSVRTLRWKQVVRLHAGRADELEHLSSQVFDEHGRWRCEFEKALRGPEGERVTIKGAMYHDGSRLVGRDDSSETGAIREYAGERRSEVALDCWLGRHLDVIHGRRLGELLLAADDLQLAGRSERGLPLIAGTANLTPLVALLEVEIDPDHGFAPRSITVRDRLILVPYFRYEVHRYRKVGDVWIPESGSLETRQYQPTPEQARQLEEALRERGLGRGSNALNAAVQAGYKEVLREVFGSLEAPSSELVPRMTIEATKIEANMEVTEEELLVEYPRAYMVLDAFRDLIKQARSDEWSENPKGHW